MLALIPTNDRASTATVLFPRYGLENLYAIQMSCELDPWKQPVGNKFCGSDTTPLNLIDWNE